MQLNTAFEQGLEQIHYVSLRIWFKLIKRFDTKTMELRSNLITVNDPI